MSSRLALLLLPLGSAARAADAPAVAAGLGQTLAGLAVVVALLLATLWLLKRVAGPRAGTGALKLLGALPVGPRERVVLVEVAGKVLVLGVAPGRVNTLHSFDAGELPGTAPAAAPADSPDPQTRLSRLLGGRK